MVTHSDPAVTAQGNAAKSLRALFGYRVTSRAYFHLPVVFVYLYVHGQRVDVILALLALYGVTVLLSAPLVSRFNVTVSRRTSLVVGELIKMVGLIALAVSPEFIWGLVIGQVLSGAGYALTSSVESAVVGMLEPDSVRAGRIQSTTQSWIFMVVLASGVSGAVIFSYTEITVFFLSALACLVAVVQLAYLRLPERTDAGESRSTGRAPLASVWPWVTYYAAIRSVALASFVGFVPYLLFVEVRVSLVFFGVLLALFNLAAFAIARWNKVIVDALGNRVLVSGSLGCLAVSMALLGFSRSPLLIGLAIALLGVAAGAARPVTQAGLTVVPAELRQRVNARMEQITGAANAAVLALGGVLLQQGKIAILLSVAAVIVLACGTILLVAAKRETAPARRPAGAG